MELPRRFIAAVLAAILIGIAAIAVAALPARAGTVQLGFTLPDRHRGFEACFPDSASSPVQVQAVMVSYVVGTSRDTVMHAGFNMPVGLEGRPQVLYVDTAGIPKYRWVQFMVRAMTSGGDLACYSNPVRRFLWW